MDSDLLQLISADMTDPKDLLKPTAKYLRGLNLATCTMFFVWTLLEMRPRQTFLPALQSRRQFPTFGFFPQMKKDQLTAHKSCAAFKQITGILETICGDK